MNTTQCPRLGLEPGPLDPESSALTMRPPRLPRKKRGHSKNEQYFLLEGVIFYSIDSKIILSNYEIWDNLSEPLDLAVIQTNSGDSSLYVAMLRSEFIFNTNLVYVVYKLNMT